MKKYLKNIFLYCCICIFLVNCGSNDAKNDSKKSITENNVAPNTTEKSTPKSRTEIDILALEKKGFFNTDTTTINVDYDPVFFRKKTYKGISLKKVLTENLDLAGVDTSNTKLFFECEDKYIVTMRLGQALHHKGYITYKDVDAPKEKRFMPAYKGDELKELDPFYVVWENTPKGDMSFVWPYNLVKIKMK